jgi:hypothetical protein
MELQLSQVAWEEFQQSLYERGDRLERRTEGQAYKLDERVDAWVLSAHAEAIYSQDIDPEVWETLEDLELEAADEEDAWRMIRSFYLERGNVVVRIGDGPLSDDTPADEREEWIFSDALATRLRIQEFAN